MQNHADSNPEELLDVFKAAALSVTKLFKTSTAAQSKARVDGYQDCLEDLLAVIDKGDADVRTLRRWILERLDGRDSVLSTVESEDEVDKTDLGVTSAAGSGRGSNSSGGSSSSSSRRANASTSSASTDTHMQTATESEMDTETEATSPVKTRTQNRTAGARSSTTPTATPVQVPTLSSTASASAMSALAAKKAAAKNARTQARGGVAHAVATAAAAAPATACDGADNSEPMAAEAAGTGGFSFRSAVPYPTESFLELANLDLSDRRSAKEQQQQQLSSSDAAMASSSSSSPPHIQQGSAPTTFIFNAPANSSNSNTNNTNNTNNNNNNNNNNADGTTTAVATPARQFRMRHAGPRTNGRSILTARYNRSSAGQKRKLNFDEIFDVASLGYGKDVFSRGGPKRSRQT